MDRLDKPLQPERLARIKELLGKEGTLKVSELSALLAVSENTVRRDLIEMERLGFCSRTKGGASTVHREAIGPAFSKRMERNKDAKRSIALKAAELVESGLTVIIDSGTTALALAKEIRKKEHITVITPSLDAANILIGNPTNTVIMPGGKLHEPSRSLTGGPAENFFLTIHADILFLTVKAISIEDGLTNHTLDEAVVKQKMIQAAERIIVLADHSKLGKTALSRICGLEEIDLLITDTEADPDFLAALKAKGSILIVAD